MLAYFNDEILQKLCSFLGIDKDHGLPRIVKVKIFEKFPFCMVIRHLYFQLVNIVKLESFFGSWVDPWSRLINIRLCNSLNFIINCSRIERINRVKALLLEVGIYNYV